MTRATSQISIEPEIATTTGAHAADPRGRTSVAADGVASRAMPPNAYSGAASRPFSQASDASDLYTEPRPRTEPYLPPQSPDDRHTQVAPGQGHQANPSPARPQHQSNPGNARPGFNPAQLRAKAAAAHVHAARFPEPDYERLRALTALYSEQRAPRRPLYRIVLTIAIFAIGASVGLGGAWWATDSGDLPAATAALEQSAPVPLPSRVRGPASSVKGISPHELPYDGTVPVPANQLPVVPKTNPEELPYGSLSSGSSDAEPEPDKASATGARGEKAVPSALPRAKEASAAPSVKRSEKDEVRASERKTARAPQRYRAERRAVKGRGASEREIERIRQQADEELKKKSEQRRALGELRTGSHSAPDQSAESSDAPHAAGRAARTRSLLARCEHAGNFFRREQCKWHLCSGMWGKNGCPSYAHSIQY